MVPVLELEGKFTCIVPSETEPSKKGKYHQYIEIHFSERAKKGNKAFLRRKIQFTNPFAT